MPAGWRRMPNFGSPPLSRLQKNSRLVAEPPAILRRSGGLAARAFMRARSSCRRRARELMRRPGIRQGAGRRRLLWPVFVVRLAVPDETAFGRRVDVVRARGFGSSAAEPERA